MMTGKYKVLIVDDHPIICDSYKDAFAEVNKEFENLHIQIEVALDCDAAREKIRNNWVEKGYDLVFLDIRLPASRDRKLVSGEDLGELIREVQPQAKIIVATTFNDNFRMLNIFKSLNPEGFLIKNDLDTKELTTAISHVIQGKPYYSSTVAGLFRKQMSQSLDIDKIDRLMLYELSMGTRMKEMPKVVPLSMAGIEKRKRILKQKFDVEDQGDKALILKAREMGFI
jgi:DNA-binding NarL/FixJ family response regulator